MKVVVMDSCYRMIFSANFGKVFYSICKPDFTKFRKIDMLQRLRLNERLSGDMSKLNKRYQRKSLER